MKTTQRWIIFLKAPSDRQMPRKLTGICPSNSIKIGTGENRLRKQCRQFGVKMTPHNAQKNENGLPASRTYVLLYQRNSRYSVRTYGLFHTHMSAENICSNRFGNGVCHRSKQGKTIGFSAAAWVRQSLGSALPNPLGIRMSQSEYIYHGIPLYFERPTA